MKSRIHTPVSILLPIALVLFLSTFVRVVSSKGTSIPFQHSEKELQACTQVNKNQNGALVFDSMDKSSSSDRSCMKLYRSFLEHYEREEFITDDRLSPSRSYSRSHEPTSWSMPPSHRNTSYFYSSLCHVRRFQRFTAVLATTGTAKPIISERHRAICVQPRTHSYLPPELKGWSWPYLRCRRMNMFSKSSRIVSHRPRK